MTQSKNTLDVETLIAAALQHGQDSESDHEAGDLQDFLREGWGLLDADQRKSMLSQPTLRSALETAVGMELRVSDVLLKDKGVEQILDAFELRREYPWADRFVMGLPLAPWQREFKWSMEQCQRFITSLWTGVHPGHYALTEAELEAAEEVRHQYLANCVLDGQQRLHALELYFLDRLAVPDAAGVPTLWSELGIVEQRWFGNRTFERCTVPLSDESALREFYDLLNFGGVAHDESERAVPSMRPGAAP